MIKIYVFRERFPVMVQNCKQFCVCVLYYFMNFFVFFFIYIFIVVIIIIKSSSSSSIHLKFFVFDEIIA